MSDNRHSVPADPSPSGDPAQFKVVRVCRQRDRGCVPGLPNVQVRIILIECRRTESQSLPHQSELVEV